MELKLLPSELRQVYEQAGLTAESTTNQQIELAMLDLRRAIDSDLNRLNAECRFGSGHMHAIQSLGRMR